TSVDGAQVLGERIRSAVEQSRFTYQEEIIRITVSIGLVVAKAGEPAEFDQIKHTAAVALAEAKHAGRNRCVFRILTSAD
ncbi:MAG: diguanylate cyclase, partial [Planctomycetes bacterium]|nr:diguanylate cyclase [Planctomycetota bacterium]